MGQGFGMEAPSPHEDAERRPPVRYLVVLESGGALVALQCLATRVSVGEIDAGTEEVTLMTRGLRPEVGAIGTEWDQALAGHGEAARAAARIYTIEV